MSGVNKVILVGRLGKDPIIKQVGNTFVANFSIATSEKFKKQDGTVVDITDWHNIVIWGKLAEIVQKYVHKGDMLYLEGKNRTRSWEKNGTTHYITEVICHEMVMLSGKPQGASNSTTSDSVNGSDDLPF